MEYEASEYPQKRLHLLEESGVGSNVNVQKKWLADQATFSFEADDFWKMLCGVNWRGPRHRNQNQG